MKNLLKFFNMMDWVMAVGLLLVGFYLPNWWLVASGVVALLCAYFNPAKRASDAIQKKFLAGKKKGPTDNSADIAKDDAFYEAMAKPQPGMSFEPKNNYAQTLVAGGVFLNNNKHNLLKHEFIGLSQITPETKNWT